MKIVEYKKGHEEKLKKLTVKLSNPLSLCWQITKKCNYNFKTIIITFFIIYYFLIIIII